MFGFIGPEKLLVENASFTEAVTDCIGGGLKDCTGTGGRPEAGAVACDVAGFGGGIEGAEGGTVFFG
jgi:hypothetical protein